MYRSHRTSLGAARPGARCGVILICDIPIHFTSLHFTHTQSVYSYSPRLYDTTTHPLPRPHSRPSIPKQIIKLAPKQTRLPERLSASHTAIHALVVHINRQARQEIVEIPRRRHHRHRRRRGQRGRGHDNRRQRRRRINHHSVASGALGGGSSSCSCIRFLLLCYCCSGGGGGSSGSSSFVCFAPPQRRSVGCCGFEARARGFLERELLGDFCGCFGADVGEVATQRCLRFKLQLCQLVVVVVGGRRTMSISSMSSAYWKRSLHTLTLVRICAFV